MSREPILIELDDDEDVVLPTDAPMLTDAPVAAPAMERAVTFAARKPSGLSRWFWAVFFSLLGFVASIELWDFVTALLARNTILGGIAIGLFAALILMALISAVRELASFARLNRIDKVKTAVASALADNDLRNAKNAVAAVSRLYSGRPDMTWAREKLRDARDDIFDAKGQVEFAERTLLTPLDKLAEAEIQSASRQVATVTAVVPLALADVVTALVVNIRMIRRIAETYGGRSGTLGNWRLTRSVMAHLVATGAVAVGDDLISSVAGGGVISKISRQFGEGVINGALTARVGIAAMEVCRPIAFTGSAPPKVTGILRRALTGLFS